MDFQTCDDDDLNHAVNTTNIGCRGRDGMVSLAQVVDEDQVVKELRGEVMQELDQDTPKAEPVHGIEPPEKLLKRSSTWYAYCGCVTIMVLFVLVGAVVIPILNAVGVFDKAPPTPPSPPTLAPTATAALPRLQVIQNVARDDALSSNESIFDPTAPQFQAVAWLNMDNGTVNVPNIAPNILLERYILAVLYYATNGMEWNNTMLINQSLPFLSDLSVCDWHVVSAGANQINSSIGVFCDLTRNHTQSILLNETTLQGTFPAEMTQFRYLQELDLSGNNLKGTLPSEVEDMTALLSLNLGSNGLSGSIPLNITHLISLTNLDLRFNGLSGSIPKEIGKMIGLQHLSIAGNKLNGTIPTEIGNLTNLIDLDFVFNTLTGTIPTEVGLLTKLKSLKLSSNKLTGNVPTEINRLTALEDYSVFAGNNVAN